MRPFLGLEFTLQIEKVHFIMKRFRRIADRPTSKSSLRDPDEPPFEVLGLSALLSDGSSGRRVIIDTSARRANVGMGWLERC